MSRARSGLMRSRQPDMPSATPAMRTKPRRRLFCDNGSAIPISPNTNQGPIRPPNSWAARVSQAPRLILTAPDALARPVTMAVWTAAA